MSQRLNAWSQRLKAAILRIGSYVLIVVLTLLLLVPNAVSEFVMVFPGLLRLGLVGLMYAFVLFFYPQFRFWAWRQTLNRPAQSTQDDRLKSAQPETTMGERLPQMRTPAATPPLSDVAMPKAPSVASDALHDSSIQTPGIADEESEAVDTPLSSTRPSSRLLEETPNIKLADWMEDKGDDDDDDFWSMLSETTKDTDPEQSDRNDAS